MGRMRFRKLARLTTQVTSSNAFRRVLRYFKLGLPVARDVGILFLTVMAILIAYRDYLKTDVRLAITVPAMGSVVLHKEISIEGTAAGGPYNGFDVYHKGPGDDEGLEVVAIQEKNENQMTSPVFPISLSLTDEQGEPRIGRHTLTVTLLSGSRRVEQASVIFDVVDCSLVVPPELAAGKPIHDPVDLRTAESISGYEFLHFIDGTQWTFDRLDPAHLDDGYHELRIAAVPCGSDEEADSVAVGFLVDNAVPAVVSIGLSDDARVSGESTLVATIRDPHLASLVLCVDNEQIHEIVGPLPESLLRDGEWGYTLEGGWQTNEVANPPAPAAEEDEGGLADGWHDVLITACDINGLCSSESARVWVDSTSPDLRWDLSADGVTPVLPTESFWLGARTTDPEASVTYSIEPQDDVIESGFLNTSGCRIGSEHAVTAVAADLAGNIETHEARFVVEKSPRAWANTALRVVKQGISAAVEPVNELVGVLASEGLSIGVGTEVSSSLADESTLMWRGMADFVSIEVSLLLGRGINSNPTLGVEFRMPLSNAEPNGDERSPPSIRPVLAFGTAVTANWQILNSLEFGTEKVSETWVKLVLPTSIRVPLSRGSDTTLKFEMGPGCKLSYLQEFVREPLYSDHEIVGIDWLTRNSAKLEITMDASISFSAKNQR